MTAKDNKNKHEKKHVTQINKTIKTHEVNKNICGFIHIPNIAFHVTTYFIKKKVFAEHKRTIYKFLLSINCETILFYDFLS